MRTSYTTHPFMLDNVCDLFALVKLRSGGLGLDSDDQVTLSIVQLLFNQFPPFLLLSHVKEETNSELAPRAR